MKLLATALFALLALGGCAQLLGGGSSTGNCNASPLVGSWKAASETITFSSGCGFTSTNCHSSAVYSGGGGSSNTGTITISSWHVSDSSCQPQPDRSCTYTITGTSLDLKCTPSGGGTYVKG